MRVGMFYHELPEWVFDLVLAVEQYEEQHAKGERCFDSIIPRIPEEVKAAAWGIQQMKKRYGSKEEL